MSKEYDIRVFHRAQNFFGTRENETMSNQSQMTHFK